LYPTQIGNPAHEATQSIDFTDQMAFSQSANCRIAGHSPDGRKTMSEERRSGSHTGGCSRGFTAGVAATNDRDVESDSHHDLRGRGFTGGGRRGQKHWLQQSVF
jgi:hypothetical protein